MLWRMLIYQFLFYVCQHSKLKAILSTFLFSSRSRRNVTPTGKIPAICAALFIYFDLNVQAYFARKRECNYFSVPLAKCDRWGE